MGGELRERAGAVHVESDGGARAGGGGTLCVRVWMVRACSFAANHGGCVSHSVLKLQRLESESVLSPHLVPSCHPIRRPAPVLERRQGSVATPPTLRYASVLV